jgi:hypothetical protein
VLFWAKNKVVIKSLKHPLPLNTQHLIQFIDELSTEQPYDNIILANSQGKIIYSANKKISSLPAHVQPLLNQIQQEQEHESRVYFSDYITTTPSSSQQAFITASIYYQRQLLGMLIIQLSNQPLTKLTQPLNGTNHNIQTLVLGHDKKLRNTILSMPHKIQLTALTDSLLVYGNRHVFTISDQNNKPFLATFDFAHVSKHLTWIILTKMDAKQATKPIKKQIYNWILLSISLLISALLVAYFGERWMKQRQEQQA